MAKLKKLEHNGFVYYLFYCPACKGNHQYQDTWKFNGNFEKPSFTPSLLNFYPAHEIDGHKIPQETICHLYLTDGKIRYCSDNPHELNGQTVDLPDLPGSS